MARGILVGLIVVFGVVFITPAFAVPPAYQGPLGNDEEPALRPYKWLWHGAKAFFYHPVARLKEGNARYPGLGTVNLGKGVVQGSIELGESAYRGTSYAPAPRKKGAYREFGTANTYVANEKFLGTIIDPLAAAALFEDPRKAQARQDAVLEKAAQSRAARMAEMREKSAGKTAFDKDRESYIGDRAKINKKSKAEQDLTKKF